jgi:hypothetical protein
MAARVMQPGRWPSSPSAGSFDRRLPIVFLDVGVGHCGFLEVPVVLVGPMLSCICYCCARRRSR